MKNFRLVFAVAILAFTGTHSAAQQSDLDRGIELFKQGNNKEAVKLLQKASRRKGFEDDPKVWNYLGIALINVGDVANSRKALGRAVELDSTNSTYRTHLAEAYRLSGDPSEAKRAISKAIELDNQNSLAYFLRGTLYLSEKQFERAHVDVDKAILLNPNFSTAFTLKSNIFVEEIGNRISSGSKMPDEYRRLKEAADILEHCLKHCQNNSSAPLQREKFETLSKFYSYYEAGGKHGAVQSSDIATNILPLKFLSNKPARYSKEGLNARIEGMVSVCVLLEPVGRVDHVIVLRGLGFGLDEQAIVAAKQIKYVPATEDGKPIARVVCLQYSFDLL